MKITILGSGAYGLALALAFNRNNNDVTVWTKIESEKEEIINTRKYEKVLPNVIIPNNINITTDLSCVKESDLVVIAIPINFFRTTCIELKEYINDSTKICIATQGIETNTTNLCHAILESIINTTHISILSGPTFAIDLANNSPSGLTLASKNTEDIKVIKNVLQSNTLTIEESNDIIGTEICGSIKNIMAIISGMLDELKQTETTKALFIVKAINEIKNIITSLNGNNNTVYSLSGIGDLILTCSSNKSRNYTLGKLIINSNKETINEYLNNNTVEGYHTLTSIYQIIKNRNIESPLIELLYQILFQEKNKDELLEILIK